jgi:hypothetical protein
MRLEFGSPRRATWTPPAAEAVQEVEKRMPAAAMSVRREHRYWRAIVTPACSYSILQSNDSWSNGSTVAELPLRPSHCQPAATAGA